jgi:peptidyl-prolyl cis-trans isomerase B (cyclophilin B)
MKKRKLLILSIALLVIVVVLGGFLAYGYIQKATYKLQRPVVTMEIEGYGTIKMELYPEMAPNTVKNFIKLINDGYYNGLTFTRVEETLIQGGAKEVAEGEKEYSINGEFSVNKYKNNELKFERGTVGLARKDYTYYSSLSSDLIEEGYNSGYAEFFIMTKAEEGFNGYYAPFGKVTEGMEIADKISQLETTVETDQQTGKASSSTTPVNPPVIKSMTVDTFGVNYGEPEVHEAFNLTNWYMSQYYSSMNQ